MARSPAGGARGWAAMTTLFHGASGRVERQADQAGRLALQPIEAAEVVGANQAPRVVCDGHHHPREPAAVAYLFLLFALWVINAIDLALTLHWISGMGWAAEGNAIMRTVAAAGGRAGFAAYKILLMTLVVLVLWWLYLQVEDRVHAARHRWQQVRARVAYQLVLAGTLALAGFYVWVVANNLRVMGYL